MRRVIIRGKRWILKYVPFLGNNLGHCDPPGKKNKEIKILMGLRGREKLEILLHEFLHSIFWDMDEETITESAHDIAKIIWEEMGNKELN